MTDRCRPRPSSSGWRLPTIKLCSLRARAPRCGRVVFGQTRRDRCQKRRVHPCFPGAAPAVVPWPVVEGFGPSSRCFLRIFVMGGRKFFLLVPGEVAAIRTLR